MGKALYLTREQVREIDRRSIEEFHIPGIVLMENAARAVAQTASKYLNGTAMKTLILCGGGNNGGDGLAVARHLYNHGAEVSIGLTISPGTFQGDALINWNIVHTMGIPAAQVSVEAIARSKPDLIIDAIFGTGLRQAPRPPFGEIVAAVENLRRPVLAVDLPSGLDCDNGEVLGECIRATVTVTFVAEKAGFRNPRAKAFTGEIVVGDIGCPSGLIRSLGQA
jgi:NAD(P)H-hydrate epimerase